MIRLAAIAVAIGGLGLAGCRTVNTVGPAEERSQPAIVDSRVDISDQSLNRAVQLIGLREAMRDDLRQIQADFRNSTRQRKHFKYRVEWLDEQGMIIRSPMSGWTDRTIMPKEVISITAIAPAPGAHDFRLKLLEN